MSYYRLIILSCFLSVFAISPVTAQKLIPPDEDVKDPLLLSLGPLGVRVETDHREERFPRSKSSSAIVRYIFTNSLAEGKLKLDDVIIGVNGTEFNKDFSSKLAEEINKSEGDKGELILNIKRNEEELDVHFKLKPIGSYGETWPYDCKKSSRILHDACDWLVAVQHENGRLEKNKQSGHFVLTSVGGLAMLGCDEEKYREPLKKITNCLINQLENNKNAEGHYKKGILELWSLNYAAIFLSEYYIATKDEPTFEALQFLNQEISRRQFHRIDEETAAHIRALRKRRGDRGEPIPPYWFGHGELSTKSTGYVHLGANTAYACVAWNLMKAAGVKVDNENLAATMDYIETAGPVGYMPYSGISNQKGKPNDAFGRTGTLAMALYLDGNRQKYTKLVNSAMAELYPKATYFSHATCVMGKANGMIGIALQNPKLFRKMMDECQHDFDLLRLSDGSFVSNPAMKNRHGKQDLTTGGSGEKHRWTTAFNALIYAIGEGKLRITNAK